MNEGCTHAVGAIPSFFPKLLDTFFRTQPQVDYNPTPCKSWPVFHSHLVAKVMLCYSVEVVMFGESLPVEAEIAEITIALLPTQGD